MIATAEKQKIVLCANEYSIVFTVLLLFLCNFRLEMHEIAYCSYHSEVKNKFYTSFYRVQFEYVVKNGLSSMFFKIRELFVSYFELQRKQ